MVFGATLEDNQAHYEGGAEDGSSSNVTCRVDLEGFQDRGENDNVLNRTRAQDVATANVTCASLDENNVYPVRVEIVFQYYNRDLRKFVNIPESLGVFTTPVQRAAQSVYPMPHNYVYEFGHYSLNKWHRAKITVIEPNPMAPLYAYPWLATASTVRPTCCPAPAPDGVS